MRWHAATAAATLVLAAALPALAGFRIEEIDPEFPEGVITSWFQGGIARVDGALEGLTVVLNLKNGEALLYDRAERRYAQGKVEDLAAQLRAYEASQSDEPPPGAAAGQGPAPGRAAQLEVAVKDLGLGERLHGYETRHFQVLVAGELVEELWLAPRLEVSREIDLAGLASALQKILGGSAGQSQGYEESEAYRALRAGGYPLRQVLYFVGEKTTLEVRSVASLAVPAADFAVPPGFTKVGYIELLYGAGK